MKPRRTIIEETFAFQFRLSRTSFINGRLICLIEIWSRGNTVYAPNITNPRFWYFHFRADALSRELNQAGKNFAEHAPFHALVTHYIYCKLYEKQQRNWNQQKFQQ
uniref:AlNc14C111G6384 protein n=1 Tax=Albugo laibachii Nc14 TaxID=890382 RepID=F0WII4_9STRA|nr:AlNc14C111G6384 [Albugo laibachii Nc14]|eukprot:CCA21066.1 AlNc14C111G6384 [Albugo laibachii Nc14]